MADPIPDILFSQLSEFVAAKTGLYFPKERWHDLERGLKSIAQEFGFSGIEACIQRLVSLPLERTQIGILASHLTVGETYFFREKHTFAALEEHIFADLIRSRRYGQRSLRIWSAGCATGEEPYSIAILLRKLIPEPTDWNITILGTDINASFLQKASQGIYSEWSFRDTPRWIKEQHFRRQGDGRYETSPEVRKMVTFSYLNLAEDNYPSLLSNTNAMDIILCRNVLMYFAPERARRVIGKFYDALTDGGWLIVSPSEASHVLFSQFATVNLREAILYKKASSPELEVASFSMQQPSIVPMLDSKCAVRETTTSKVSRTSVEPSTLDFKSPEVEAAIAHDTLDSSFQTPYHEALALHDQGRYAEAAEKLSTWLLDNGTNAQAMALLARLYANQGKLGEAIAWCEKALAGDKLNPAFHFLQGMILQEQGALEEAIRSLKRSLYLDQNFILGHFALGSLALRQGRSVDSNKHFENAISLLSIVPAEEILPESDGLTAGRLREIILASRDRESLNGRSLRADSAHIPDFPKGHKNG